MKKLIIIILVLLGIIVIYSVVEGVRKHKEEANQMTKNETVGAAETVNFDGEYVVDAKASKATWTGKKKILVEWIDKGTIDVKSGEVNIKGSETDWAGTEGKIVFDMTTIRSSQTKGEAGESSKLDGHLKSADFFDVAKYPESVFVLKKVTKNNDGTFNLDGDLTIKDVTKPVTLASITNLDVVDGSDGKAIEARGRVTFNRADYNVKFGSDSFFDNLGDNVIENEVALDLVIVAVKK